MFKSLSATICFNHECFNRLIFIVFISCKRLVQHDKVYLNNGLIQLKLFMASFHWFNLINNK